MSGSGRIPRVLQLGKYFPPHRGGIETHLELLATALHQSLDVRAVVAGGGRFSTRVETVAGLRVERLATPMTLASTPVCPGMADAIRASAADLIHLHFPNPMAALAYLRSGSHAPLVITWHSDVVRQRIMGRLLRPLIDAVLARSRAIVVTSPNYLASSAALRPWRTKARIIPYGIPRAQIRPPEPAWLRALHQRYGERLVLGVGRLVYYKGWEYLIDAMAQVDGVLLLVGDGPLRHKLERQVRRGGLSQRVVFLGELAWREIVPYYFGCQVFVLASVARSEAFGIVQLEAMAAGRPVVNTGLDTGVPFVSPDGVTGITVAPRKSAELVGAIGRLLDDPELARSYGERGMQRVQELFGLDKMVGQMLELYAELLEYPTADGLRWRPPPAADD
jgi:glycosyltransferase involved in cell wall biosynthesis